VNGRDAPFSMLDANGVLAAGSWRQGLFRAKRDCHVKKVNDPEDESCLGHQLSPLFGCQFVYPPEFAKSEPNKKLKK